jgi:transposase
MTSLLAANRFLSSRQLCKELEGRNGLIVSSRTVRNQLKRIDYHSSIPKTVPFMTAASMTNRVDFATQNLERNWTQVFFSDETILQLGANMTRAWHPRGQRPINPKKRFPGKIMFWSAVSTWSKFDLVEIQGTLNAQGYIDMLRLRFFPWLQKQKKGAFIFQQDNAPCHTAKLTQAYFQEENIMCLCWPPYSPDLNPIENLWGILKMKVDAQKPTTIEQLRQFSHEEWDKIPLDTVRKCIESMPKRLAGVIESNGEKVNY